MVVSWIVNIIFWNSLENISKDIGVKVKDLKLDGN